VEHEELARLGGKALRVEAGKRRKAGARDPLARMLVRLAHVD